MSSAKRCARRTPRVEFKNDGALAQGIEPGVQLHMGRYFGRANLLVMLAACLGVVLLCVSAR